VDIRENPRRAEDEKGNEKALFRKPGEVETDIGGVNRFSPPDRGLPFLSLK
jgi:hypothetical protein